MKRLWMLVFAGVAVDSGAVAQFGDVVRCMVSALGLKPVRCGLLGAKCRAHRRLQ